MKVSIIVPVFNVESHVARTIESLLMQTFNDSELILINDGSTDDSLKVCQRYEEKDSRIIIIDRPNQGSGIARNNGLKAAQGDYVYFVDADDYVEVDLLKDNLAIAEKNKADLVVFGHFDEVISAKGKIKRKENRPDHQDMPTQRDFRINFGEYYHSNADVLWNKLYKREFLTDHNILFTNQKVGEDALFNILVYKDIKRVFFNPKVYHHYVYREGSAVHSYHPTRFEYEYQVSKGLEELILYWGLEKEYGFLINKRYFAPVYAELKGFALKDCPLSSKEKMSRLRDILNDPDISNALDALENHSTLSNFSKLTVILLQRNQLFISILLFKIRFS